MALAFDRGRPQHEAVIATRDHIERKAWMDQPHRTRQFNFVSLDQNKFALDAAKLALVLACREPAAIDHDASCITLDILRLELAVERDGATGLPNARMQFGQDLARLDMAFVGVKKSLAKTPLKRRFDLADALRVQPPVTACQPREAFEIGPVARMRHHQRAVERGLREILAPEF